MVGSGKGGDAGGACGLLVLTEGMSGILEKFMCIGGLPCPPVLKVVEGG